LQLLIFNEEFLVIASHQLALITSLPFVHTARRCYRLSARVKFSDRERPDGFHLNDHGKLLKSCYLEEAKVVTRFP
jgi:hypothetical protein